ncbi:MAG: UpxY family transcription antiterminator [Bacteroidales bacterium]|jgi:transcription antitermination factor NusG|nr:UpxY family transcription antiterminator [Bacteroidales bacterium]MDD3664867.1 UpxY family transcription antiterminator [Bacteroidales bacterium]
MENFWHVIYTAPRAEKRVHAQLIEMGVETYLPLHQVIRQWADRKKQVELPLFTSYVFVNNSEREYYDILQTNGVVRFVYHCGRPAIIKAEEIMRIRQFLEKTRGYRTWLEPEMEVEIVKGPLCGSVGRIERVGRHKLRLRISALGLIVQAELDRESIRVLQPA